MISFSYTKADGSTSERVAIIVQSPVPNFMMLDLSNVSEEVRDEIKTKYEAFQKESEARQKEFFEQNIPKGLIKAFKKDGISNVEVL